MDSTMGNNTIIGYNILAKKAIETESGINIDEALKKITAYRVVRGEGDDNHPSSEVTVSTKIIYFTKTDKGYLGWIWVDGEGWVCAGGGSSDSWKVWSEEHGCSASNEDAVYIGFDNTSDADYPSFQIGHDNTTTGTVPDYVEPTELVSLNLGAKNVIHGEGINIGKKNTSDNFAIAIGQNNISHHFGIAIGEELTVNNGSVGIGKRMSLDSGAYAIGSNSTDFRVGYGSHLFGSNNSGILDNGSYLFGGQNNLQSTYGSIIVGLSNQLLYSSAGGISIFGCNNIIGNGDGPSGSVALGNYHDIKGAASVSLGIAAGSKNCSIAISAKGTNSQLGSFADSGSIAIGNRGVYAYDGSTSIGTDGVASHYHGISIGHGGVHTYNYSFAFGNRVTAHSYSLALGMDGCYAYEQSISVGRSGSVSLDRSMTFGREGVFAWQRSIAIGEAGVQAISNAVALGLENVKGNSASISVGRAGVYTYNASVAFGNGGYADSGSMSLLNVPNQSSFSYKYDGNNYCIQNYALFWFSGKDGRDGYVDVKLTGISKNSDGYVVNGTTYPRLKDVPFRDLTAYIRGYVDEQGNIVPYYTSKDMLEPPSSEDSWVLVNWNNGGSNDDTVSVRSSFSETEIGFGASGGSLVVGNTAACATNGSVAISLRNQGQEPSFSLGLVQLSNNTITISPRSGVYDYVTGQMAPISLAEASSSRNSLAIGTGSKADNGSTAIGVNSFADRGSMAMGYGLWSTTNGFGKAIDDSLIISTVGYPSSGVRTRGESFCNSIAIGSGPYSSNSSQSIGVCTRGTNKSTSIGYYSRANDESIAIGDDNESKYNAIGIGTKNLSSGWSIALGVNNTSYDGLGGHATMIGQFNTSTSNQEVIHKELEGQFIPGEPYVPTESDMGTISLYRSNMTNILSPALTTDEMGLFNDYFDGTEAYYLCCADVPPSTSPELENLFNELRTVPAYVISDEDKATWNETYNNMDFYEGEPVVGRLEPQQFSEFCSNYTLYFRFLEGIRNKIISSADGHYETIEEEVVCNSFLVGNSNTSNHYNSILIGALNESKTPLVQPDPTYHTTDDDGFMIAIGYRNEVGRNYDIAIGHKSKAIGGENVAIQHSTAGDGNNSYHNLAMFDSTALGTGNTAIQQSSVDSGFNNIAINQSKIDYGNNNFAMSNSNIYGYNNIALNDTKLVLGDNIDSRFRSEAGSQHNILFNSYTNISGGHNEYSGDYSAKNFQDNIITTSKLNIASSAFDRNIILQGGKPSGDSYGKSLNLNVTYFTDNLMLLGDSDAYDPVYGTNETLSVNNTFSFARNVLIGPSIELTGTLDFEKNFVLFGNIKQNPYRPEGYSEDRTYAYYTGNIIFNSEVSDNPYVICDNIILAQSRVHSTVIQPITDESTIGKNLIFNTKLDVTGWLYGPGYTPVGNILFGSTAEDVSECVSLTAPTGFSPIDVEKEYTYNFKLFNDIDPWGRPTETTSTISRSVRTFNFGDNAICYSIESTVFGNNNIISGINDSHIFGEGNRAIYEYDADYSTSNDHDGLSNYGLNIIGSSNENIHKKRSEYYPITFFNNIVGHFNYIWSENTSHDNVVIGANNWMNSVQTYYSEITVQQFEELLNSEAVDESNRFKLSQTYIVPDTYQWKTREFSYDYYYYSNNTIYPIRSSRIMSTTYITQDEFVTKYQNGTLSDGTWYRISDTHILDNPVTLLRGDGPNSIIVFPDLVYSIRANKKVVPVGEVESLRYGYNTTGRNTITGDSNLLYVEGNATDNRIYGQGNKVVQDYRNLFKTLTETDIKSGTIENHPKFISGSTFTYFYYKGTTKSVTSNRFYQYYKGGLCEYSSLPTGATLKAAYNGNDLIEFAADRSLMDGCYYQATSNGTTIKNVLSLAYGSITKDQIYTIEDGVIHPYVNALYSYDFKHEDKNSSARPADSVYNNTIIGGNNLIHSNTVGYSIIGNQNEFISCDNSLTKFAYSNGFIQGNDNIGELGSNIIVMGNGNHAIGHNSVAIGSQLISNQWQTVIGKYNYPIAGPNRLAEQEPQSPNAALFIIGNGYSTTDQMDWKDESKIQRSNAMVVYADGTVRAKKFVSDEPELELVAGNGIEFVDNPVNKTKTISVSTEVADILTFMASRPATGRYAINSINGVLTWVPLSTTQV